MEYRKFEGTPNQITEIMPLVHQSYKEVALKHHELEEKIHTLEYCHDLSDAITEKCRRLDYQANRWVSVYRDNRAYSHVRLDSWIIDANWQYFLHEDYRNPGLPRVLFITEERLSYFLSAYNVDPYFLPAWLFSQPI